MQAIVTVEISMCENQPMFFRLPVSAFQLEEAGVPGGVTQIAAEEFNANVVCELIRNSRDSEVLRALLRQFPPQRVAFCKGELFAALSSEANPDAARSHWAIYIPLKHTFDDYFFGQTRVSSTIRPFSGIRDNLDTIHGELFAGVFTHAPSLIDASIGFDSSRDVWGESAIVFHASNGDMLVCDRNGNAGWLVLELGDYRPVGSIHDFAPYMVSSILLRGRLSYWTSLEALRSKDSDDD